MAASLDPAQLDRYSRQIVLESVGPDGQGQLLDSAVLVVGVGGLGAPVVQYLAAAGVGRLGLVDGDVVERSNLQRQVVHGTEDVGRPKVDSAAAFVGDLNPDVTVQTHETTLSAENAPALIDEYDVVVDATDNFPARFLINDACTLTGTPFVHGAVYRFEGQVTTFDGTGPCYRCLFPTAPPEDAIPDCATAGVLGILPGTIGTIQATETIKHLLALGDSLQGRVLHYDATTMNVDEVPLQSRPECPICGDQPAVDSVQAVTYEGDCAITE
ncbi:molybdopterin-synthase adenylyltransferase MoeB [Halorhabdus sp. CUG00001]|uniref:HesA/MoeB/ThiF family protein n=1 Tax=Halorhabdus sp. CUG00001 TaxID=2600297 RepID=UPI00131C289C|nr:molybdopterin-synthase adenylyltransferase MoeB [Halorhabdus sp. CUG00001]